MMNGRMRLLLSQKSAGFSLFEIFIVIALLVILFSITTISFYSILKRDELATTTQQLLSTLKEAQTKTLSGTTVDDQNSTNFGVYFEDQRYILFEGESYLADNPNNSPPVNLQPTIVLSQINFPNNQVVFEKVTGQVKDFSEDQNTLVIKNNADNQTKTITINKFGIINVQ